jgi:putative ABC transport system permease protein
MAHLLALPAIFCIMLKNYFIVAWRNILRNRVFSLINISGLAIGLTVGFLIFQYVRFELSYDHFNADASRIYRVPIAYKESKAFSGMSAPNHPALGPAMKAEFPEVEDFARLVRTNVFMNTFTLSNELHTGGPATFNESLAYLADASLLTIFSFPLKEGDAAVALKDPRTIVLTETAARKYFGSEPALGKTLTLNGDLYLKVTGVLKDLPPNSHLQFDILLSIATLGDKFGETMWGWPEFYTYVRLAPGADPRTVEAKFPPFIENHLGSIMKEFNFRTEFFLQPITSIHLYSHLGLEQDVNGSSRTVYFLVLLAIFVLVVAWINYINLSTAKSLERSKEVGLRKVAGASKKQLVVQFFTDALLVNTLAVLLALLLLSIATPYFEAIVGKPITAALHTSGWAHEIMFVLPVIGALFTGTLLVGLYPALLVSSFNPALVLKGKFHKSQSGAVLRQGLVSFQYVLSIFLIAGTIAIYKQMKYMEESDPGYVKDQMLVLRSPSVYDSTISQRMRTFEHALGQLPAIAGFAASEDVPGQVITGRNTVRRIEQPKEEDRLTFLVGVSPSFFETYKIPLLAGHTFEETDDFFGAVPRAMINEQACQSFGFESPDDAIGRKIVVQFGQGPKIAEVIGVVKNYHQSSFKDVYRSILYYRPGGEDWKYITIHLNTHDLTNTLTSIREAYTGNFPHNAFDYFFLDDHFNRQYQSDRRFGTIFGIFTALAIIIACLGLFGLSIFAVTQRTKEVGIRKVLGASVPAILAIFSRDSIKLVLISYAIAAPLIYLAVRSWLSGFAFHIGMQWEIFLLPPLLLLAISLGTIVVVCLRAALANPTRALRHE